MNDEVIYVGKYNTKYNNILGLNYKEYEIVRSKGLPSHMIKRKHFCALKHIDDIKDIVNNPDYIGYDSKEENKSILFIKKFETNILLTCKVDIDNDRLYVATVYEKEDKKIQRWLHSGRIIALTNQ